VNKDNGFGWCAASFVSQVLVIVIVMVCYVVVFLAIWLPTYFTDKLILEKSLSKASVNPFSNPAKFIKG
jgi:hypothetical protein